jgi:phosphoribosylformylglycinamidine cyclo-ligase
MPSTTRDGERQLTGPGSSTREASTREASTYEASTYEAAGVSIEAGDKAVALMASAVASTHRAEVVGGIGGFAGLFSAAGLARRTNPLLATSTDGIGTKSAIATLLGRYDTVGYDLVGMVVDDLVVCGAEPLFMTDYIACGRVVPDRIAEIVSGVAAACRDAGCALLGGETAEHPGMLGVDDFDLAGAATGVVDAADLLGAERVRAGDVLIALASSGIHANGLSLARHVLLDREAGAGWTVDRFVPEFGRTLGEELIEPTRVYARDCLDLAAAVEVHAYAHITGGGLAGNLARVLPAGVRAVVDRSTWTPPAVFTVTGEVGRVPAVELERTFNMGVGMVAVVPPAAVEATVGLLADRGQRAWVLGSIEDAPRELAGSVELTGTH